MRKKPFTLKQRAIRCLSYKQLHFLVENNVLDIYLKNVVEGKRQICNRREGTKEATFLLDSFTWLYTPEGFKFWNFLNHKYLSAYYPGLSDVTKK